MTATPPPQMMNDLLALIQRTWGYRALRPLQQPAMQAFIDRRKAFLLYQ